VSDLRKSTSEWSLWVVAASCAVHAAEEYLTGWQAWAVAALGIHMPTGRFVFMNAVLVGMALASARVGWSLPALSLVVPAATLVNGVFFHILPTIAQGRVSPGVYSATLLYLPFSSWALVGAVRDGVPARSVVFACAAGTLMMTAVVVGSRWLGEG
jgi:Protein of unknown function with HXXEE motif